MYAIPDSMRKVAITWSGFFRSGSFPAKASFCRFARPLKTKKKHRDCSQVLDLQLLNSLVGRE
jgi:hypothetical protein